MNKIANKRLKKQPINQNPVNMYSDSFASRCNQLALIKRFKPTVLSEFAAGYCAALDNIQVYGLKRVLANCSGLPK